MRKCRARDCAQDLLGLALRAARDHSWNDTSAEENLRQHRFEAPLHQGIVCGQRIPWLQIRTLSSPAPLFWPLRLGLGAAGGDGCDAAFVQRTNIAVGTDVGVGGGNLLWIQVVNAGPWTARKFFCETSPDCRVLIFVARHGSTTIPALCGV